LLQPTVKTFFSTKSGVYLNPELVNLAKPLGFGGGDKIVSHEDPAKWKVNPLRFL
jgi:hypothetical protein